MNARANLIVSRVCWIAMAIIAIGLIFGPVLCFAQVLGRPASESYVTSKINAHASTNNAHADIRAQVFAATTNVNALTIAATNATEAAHAATVQANAAILKNTQQDVDISYLYASNANTMAIANLANIRAQAANVTNAQNGAAIASVSNLTVTAQATANAAVGGVTAVSNLVIGVKALNENAITNETDLIALSVIATNRTTIVFNPTNALEWIEGSGQKWRVSQIAVTNEEQRIMWDSEIGSNVLTLFANNQWRVYLDNDLYAYCGDYYLDDIAVYAAVQQTDEWPYGIVFYQCNPPGLTDWPKTYSRDNGKTGWVDRVISYQTVTQGVDRVRFFSDDSALTNTILQAVANSYPEFPTNALALASNAWQQAILAQSQIVAATNALVQTYLLNNSIVSTAVACTNVITVTSTQSVYVAAITSPCVISQDVSRLSLATNQTAQWTTKLDMTSWSATNGVTFAANIAAVAGEFTVTGCYEFACSTLCNGMIQMRQAYPEIPQWRVPASSIWKSGYAPTWYASELYANSVISIITGSTNSCLIYASSPCIIELSGTGAPLVQPIRTNILHVGSADIAGKFSEEYAINLNWNQHLSPLRVMVTNSTFGTFPELRLETLVSTSQSTYVFPVRSRSATTHELRASALGWKP